MHPSISDVDGIIYVASNNSTLPTSVYFINNYKLVKIGKDISPHSSLAPTAIAKDLNGIVHAYNNYFIYKLNTEAEWVKIATGLGNYKILNKHFYKFGYSVSKLINDQFEKIDFKNPVGAGGYSMGYTCALKNGKHILRTTKELYIFADEDTYKIPGSDNLDSFFSASTICVENTIYRAAKEGIIWTTPDEGVNWEKVGNAPLPNGQRADDMILIDNNLYVKTTTNGHVDIYVSKHNNPWELTTMTLLPEVQTIN